MATSTPPISENTGKKNRRIETIQFDREIIIGESKKLRSCEIGQDTKNTKEKVFMVVGESGVGKTSVINFMVNYILGVKFEDDLRYQLDLDEEEKTLHKRQSESQTRWITSYKINEPKRGAVSFRITIIDSPGFGDTGGEKKDKFTNEQIRSYFTDKTGNGIDHIDAVAFVLKATTTRLNDSQKFVFESVLKIFGKDISQNIFLFLTHASSHAKPEVLDAVKDAKVPFAKFYKFDNQLLFKDKSESEDISSPEEFTFIQRMHWNMGCRSLDECFKDLNSVSPKSLTLSAHVLLERQSLEVTLDAIPELIKDSIVTLNELAAEQKILENYEKKMDKNKSFSSEKVIHVTDKENMKNGELAMVCNKCEFTCHSPCAHLLTSVFTTCSTMNWISVMRGCSCCPGRCSPGNHTQEDFKYVKRAKTITLTNEDVKKMYDKAKNDMKIAGETTRLRHKEMVLARERVDEYVEEARDCLERLNQIALRPDPQTILGYLGDLVQKERVKDEDGCKGRENELKQLMEREEKRESERQASGKKEALKDCFSNTAT